MTDERTSILVIDDDNAFRKLVVDLLRSKKYRVVEARSAEEANAIFSPRDIALAIVDYRLAGTDGMAWITQMRDAGRNMPVIFVSGTECDQKTFNWLRNILRVSLIVKKPIIPAVFLEQIEFVLPSNIKILLTEGEGVSSSQEDLDELNSPLSAQGLVRQLMQIHNKLDVKTAIEVAQANYAQAVRVDWHALVALMPAIKNNLQDGKMFIDASSLAHKLKGTAGSLGLPEISEVAARVEDFLRNLEPVSSAEQDQRWQDIAVLIASGQSAVDSNLDEHTNVKLEEMPKPRILLVTGDDNLVRAAAAVEDFAIDSSGSLAGARMKLQRTAYDAAIVDLNLANKETAFALCEEIRATSNDSIPLALVEPRNLVNVPTRAEILFSGISQVLDGTASSEVSQICSLLMAARRDQKPRILAVDDDKVLTSYLSTVLAAYGMETHVVNSPVMTMGALEEFDPDLVLLDVNMPGLTGYEVCRSIRESEKWKNLPVLFLTGKTTTEARSAAYQAGGNDFLNKPILTDELLTRVNSQLDKKVRQSGRLAKDSSGLFTEEVFMASAEKILTSAGETVALALIRLDNPESVRVVHGSDSLRAVVHRLASLLLTHFKAEDLRCRLGYENFAILIKGHNKHVVATSIDLLLQAFSHENFSGLQNNFKATFTTGLADSVEDGASIYQLLGAAGGRLQNAQREQFGSIAVTN